ncbi:GNAT family N-acetyltransferase [Amycolatopsis rhabdoformis]|uniref:GNAT family N-acetyltransferase n=1 Tax=Amycolatopsis rhabdoformis TaxID=1448059 RepID=A0ABZ1IFJ9_9PSEU|nr:GNAT family N-acetyltransferase [Amycolatopsis rhabdoformis]WSE32433.1 GNAT family N-acetyltransferase [Amycolatopsis rhabdoformis]
MIEISPLRAEDRDRWEELARGYKKFYRTDVSPEEYDQTWQRLLQAEEVFGCAARLDDGQLVGIAHYLFHANPWAPRSCYLQDLFVDETVRGHGTGRLLIEYVAQAARDSGAARLYWQTKQDNDRARLLYDKVATFRGFISYDYPLK